MGCFYNIGYHSIHSKSKADMMSKNKPARPTYENGDTNPCTQNRTAIQKPQ